MSYKRFWILDTPDKTDYKVFTQNPSWIPDQYKIFEVIEVEALNNLKKLAQNLVDDIEAPMKLGVTEINPNWKALNELKQFLKSLEGNT